jgi:hypothetical protein
MAVAVYVEAAAVVLAVVVRPQHLVMVTVVVGLTVVVDGGAVAVALEVLRELHPQPVQPVQMALKLDGLVLAVVAAARLIRPQHLEGPVELVATRLQAAVVVAQVRLERQVELVALARMA